MNFIPYEDVPLYIAVSGNEGEYIFAESANISVSQSIEPVRYIDDNKVKICQFVTGRSTEYPYIGIPLSANSPVTGLLGPSGGPPKPLSTSIYKIPSGTKVTFPNGKHLYFDYDVFPNGHDYITRFVPRSGGWSLSSNEAQSGYFEPQYRYSSSGPVKGSMSVSFYVNTGNLPNFFNITGISNPSKFPPIDEEKLTGFLGDFKFTDAYLKSFNFELKPNSISQASAAFDIYGSLEKDTSLTSNYYSSSLYSQQSIPHGEDSTIIGSSDLGISNPMSLSYKIDVSRDPRYEVPTGSRDDSGGLVPTRVSKKQTSISMSIAGESIDPNLLQNGFDGKRANLTAHVRDLNYDSFEDNSNGLLHTFECSGIVSSQSLSVNSNGYLQGQISVKQHLR